MEELRRELQATRAEAEGWKVCVCGRLCRLVFRLGPIEIDTTRCTTKI